MKDKKEIRKIYLSIEEEFNNELVVLDSYKEISTRIKEKEELLETCLTRNDFELFEEYLDIEVENTNLIMEESFIKGFSMAYKLLVDSLT